jgi:glyoxylase-like metal-dependent hydrolase (beta-lactamase superfamily II)
MPLVDLPDLPLKTVADGEEVAGFTAYATPGHTPGHTSFVHEEYRLALVGDLFNEDDGELKPSPWAICYDVAQNRRSIQRFADRTDDLDVLAMGHGDPVRHHGSDRLRELADGL